MRLVFIQAGGIPYEAPRVTIETNEYGWIPPDQHLRLLRFLTLHSGIYVEVAAGSVSPQTQEGSVASD